MSSKVVATATVRAIKGRKLIPTRAALTLTPAAVERIKVLLTGKPECTGLKVGVRQRGCNGLSYYIDYAKEKADKLDEEVCQDGVKVYIDKKAQLSLLGKGIRYFNIYCDI
ncbi:ISCA1 family protein [Megaselia abdita]